MARQAADRRHSGSQFGRHHGLPLTRRTRGLRSLLGLRLRWRAGHQPAQRHSVQAGFSRAYGDWRAVELSTGVRRSKRAVWLASTSRGADVAEEFAGFGLELLGLRGELGRGIQDQ